ncbi:ankyrin repeat-containing protein At5g02620-like [Capsicum annuum]|uniref:ankyrin repeat-containing protein At5g02620-like n=1 Tax=Capsicum annuum TaxID=4072 RepID=UPI001FB08F45|nr:ankyrin repeat-containing protein At5g02620-like [Capsicum annuum]
MGNTILHVAAHYGHSNFVAEVLKITPALLCNQNRKNETVLHIEANEGHIEVVHLLFSIEDHYKEKLMRMTDENGAPTLHKAVRSRHEDVASFLVKEDPEFEFPSNKEKETPMYLAAKSSLREALVEILNSCKKPTSSTDPLNRTPLHAAVIQEHTTILYSQESVVNFLLKPKRDKLIKDPDNDGNTPLHFLASSNF